MSEVTCPKCKQMQKLSSNKLCSYCYYNFAPNKNIYHNSLSATQDSMSNNEIKEFLNLPKPQIDSFEVIGISVLIVLVCFILFMAERSFFPVYTFSESNKIYSIYLILPIFTTILIYSGLSKKYDLKSFIEHNINHNRWGKESSLFEKYIYFIMMLFFTNALTLFFFISAFNSFSSIIFLPQTYDVFVIRKYDKVVGKGGRNYYLETTNWQRNQETYATLGVKSKSEWEKYEPDKKARIKVRRGIFNEVVWSLKQ